MVFFRFVQVAEVHVVQPSCELSSDVLKVDEIYVLPFRQSWIVTIVFHRPLDFLNDHFFWHCSKAHAMR